MKHSLNNSMFDAMGEQLHTEQKPIEKELTEEELIKQEERKERMRAMAEKRRRQ